MVRRRAGQQLLPGSHSPRALYVRQRRAGHDERSGRQQPVAQGRGQGVRVVQVHDRVVFQGGVGGQPLHPVPAQYVCVGGVAQGAGRAMTDQRAGNHSGNKPRCQATSTVVIMP